MSIIVMAFGFLILMAGGAALFGLIQGDEPFTYGITGLVVGVGVLILGIVTYLALKAFFWLLVPACILTILALLIVGGITYRQGGFERFRWDNVESGEMVYRFKGKSNTKDVLGPLELPGGMYILHYRAQGDAVSTPSLHISVENITGDDSFFDTDEQPVKQSDGAQIEAIPAFKGGLCEGRESMRLKGGHYMLKLALKDVSQWQLSLYRADVRKGKEELM